MVKKSPPLLEESEIDQLVKDADKRVKKPVKKPIEKEELIEPIKSKIKPKPIKKEVKKEQEKIVKAIKIFEDKKEVKKIVIEPTPDIILEIKTVTRYDLNWYYLKEKFINFKRWLFTPYRYYENWFNRSFNVVNYEKLGIIDHYITIDEMYENIPQLEKRIHNNVEKAINKKFGGE